MYCQNQNFFYRNLFLKNYEARIHYDLNISHLKSLISVRAIELHAIFFVFGGGNKGHFDRIVTRKIMYIPNRNIFPVRR